jgi:hypothetical protein
MFQKVLLVDHSEAARAAGKEALAALGCLVVTLATPFDARFSANGHKNAGKPYDVALVNLHAYPNPGEGTLGKLEPSGFAFATDLVSIGIPYIAVAGVEHVNDPSFHKSLERFGERPFQSGNSHILLLYPDQHVPTRNGTTDWGEVYTLLQAAFLPAAA